MPPEQGEIVPAEETHMLTLGSLSVDPEQVIARATAIAVPLADVIRQKHLYKSIGKKDYVFVDGWTTLGAMLGVVPVERSSVELPDGAWESKVDLIRVRDGGLVGSGSALCDVQESRWSGRDRYAVKSMATTRATGKAFRLSFSWIMQLAGFAPTPAEEMEAVEDHEREAKAKAASQRPLLPDKLREFIGKKVEKYGEQSASQDQIGLAMGMLTACFAPDADADEKRHAVLHYLFKVESGKDLAGAEILTLLDWLKPTRDSGGGYMPDAMAVKEARRCYGAAMREAGQEILWPDPDNDPYA